MIGARGNAGIFLIEAINPIGSESGKGQIPVVNASGKALHGGLVREHKVTDDFNGLSLPPAVIHSRDQWRNVFSGYLSDDPAVSEECNLFLYHPLHSNFLTLNNLHNINTPPEIASHLHQDIGCDVVSCYFLAILIRQYHVDRICSR